MIKLGLAESSAHVLINGDQVSHVEEGEHSYGSLVSMKSGETFHVINGLDDLMHVLSNNTPDKCSCDVLSLRCQVCDTPRGIDYVDNGDIYCKDCVPDTLK